MQLFKYMEVFAMFCNISANFYLMFKLCKNPNTSVPLGVLMFQVLGNISWVLFAIFGIHDLYLTLTSGTSLIMQLTSFYLRSQIVSGNILLSASEEKLKQFERC